MKFLKIILLLVAIGLGAYVLLWLFGFVASLLWYAFWIGLIAGGAGIGYKLFLSGEKEDTPQLTEKKPTAISELQNADRTLEEYKQKYLSEEDR